MFAMMNVDEYYSGLSYLKLDSSRLIRLLLSASFAVRHQLYPQWTLVLWESHMSLKKHSNAAAQSSRGSASKGQMQLTSYLWKKLECYGKTMEKLWNFFSGNLYEPWYMYVGRLIKKKPRISFFFILLILGCLPYPLNFCMKVNITEWSNKI